MLSDAGVEDVELIAISTDDREKQQMMIDRVREQYEVEIDYTLLEDVDHRVVDRYGIFNPDGPPGRPVPHPTTLVIDTEGVIRWFVTETDYRLRPENEEILEQIAMVQMDGMD